MGLRWWCGIEGKRVPHCFLLHLKTSERLLHRTWLNLTVPRCVGVTEVTEGWLQRTSA